MMLGTIIAPELPRFDSSGVFSGSGFQAPALDAAGRSSPGSIHGMVGRMLPRAPGTKAIAFIATSQPANALVFYRDTLGLALLEDTPFAIVFDAFGTQLRVQKVETVAAHPYTSFGLEVPDIAEAARALGQAGVELLRYGHFQQDELGIWTAPSGARVAWFHDPDHNVVSLSQF